MAISTEQENFEYEKYQKIIFRKLFCLRKKKKCWKMIGKCFEKFKKN